MGTTDRIKVGTDGNLYRLSVSNGSEYSSKGRLYTKADMIAMLEELQMEIGELKPPLCHNASHAKGCADKWRVEGLIQQKINALKEIK